MSRLWDHGDQNRYKQGCRCQPCTNAASRADAERRLDRISGRPRTIPSDEVAVHIRQLLDAGLTRQQIARESKSQSATVIRLLKGQKTVRQKTAHRILSVPVRVRVSLGDVQAIGAVRRIRALYCLGHFNWEIAREAGISRDAVSALAAGEWPTLKVKADSGVRAAYDRLSMVQGCSWKTRRWAQEEGWSPPLAWDDDTIDDPATEPQVDPAPPKPVEGPQAVDRWLLGESVILDRDGRRAAIVHLMEWSDETPEQIAERLDMTADAVSRSWERSKAAARADGRRLWRRVYIPLQERGLNRDEMESAA